MKRTIQYILIPIVATLLLSSCSGFLKEYSQDLTRPKTSKDLEEILFGGNDGYVPSREVKSLGHSQVGAFINLMDDDIAMIDGYTSTADVTVMDHFVFGYFTWQKEVGRAYNLVDLHDDNALWNDLYHRINSMNILIKTMEEVDTSTDEYNFTMHRVLGEAYFLRAQWYFILTNLYGDPYAPATAAQTLGVPLKLTEYVEHDKSKEVQFPRTTLDVIYDQLVADLNASIHEFSQIDVPGTDHLRASKEAAYLLLSRVYLFKQDWAKAKETADLFLATKPTLSNIGSFAKEDVFLTGSNPEVIFSQGNFSLQQGFANSIGQLCVTRDLYDLYEDNDIRKQVYFNSPQPTDSVVLNRKYSMYIHQSKVSDIFMLRTSEGYLNAAEAAAMMGDDAGARNYLNQLREKRLANFEPLPATLTGEQMVQEVRNERRRELCFEGHRWFDLRRYSVNEKYPFSKTIVHDYVKFDRENRNLRLERSSYVLQPKDKAYTLAIPKAVIKFDPEMIDNERPDREGIRVDDDNTDK